LERISDTVEFFPQHSVMPRLLSTDTIVKMAIDLIDALQNLKPAAPFAKLGEEQLAALHTLAQIFQQVTTPTPPRVLPTPKASPLRVLRTKPPINQPRYPLHSQQGHCNLVQPTPAMLIIPQNHQSTSHIILSAPNRATATWSNQLLQCSSHRKLLATIQTPWPMLLWILTQEMFKSTDN
jgi:hypothetical protein